MVKILGEVTELSKVHLESDENGDLYPTRNIGIKEFISNRLGKMACTSIYGTAIMSDALQDLHVGDLIYAGMIFSVFNVDGKRQQNVTFSNIVKLKIEDD